MRRESNRHEKKEKEKEEERQIQTKNEEESNLVETEILSNVDDVFEDNTENSIEDALSAMELID